jgi:hypothetical protein
VAPVAERLGAGCSAPAEGHAVRLAHDVAVGSLHADPALEGEAALASTHFLHPTSKTAGRPDRHRAECTHKLGSNVTVIPSAW